MEVTLFQTLKCRILKIMNEDYNKRYVMNDIEEITISYKQILINTKDGELYFLHPNEVFYE